jgi:hypothetical protein
MPTRNSSGTAISDTVRIASPSMKCLNVECPVLMRTTHVRPVAKATPSTIIQAAR